MRAEKRAENREVADTGPRCTDWQGKRREIDKTEDLKTKREAEEWLRNFRMTQTSDFDMKFDEFLKLYYADMETRLREHTMRTKKYIIELKILTLILDRNGSTI